jgi:hypothetical protein
VRKLLCNGAGSKLISGFANVPRSQGETELQPDKSNKQKKAPFLKEVE